MTPILRRKVGIAVAGSELDRPDRTVPHVAVFALYGPDVRGVRPAVDQSGLLQLVRQSADMAGGVLQHGGHQNLRQVERAAGRNHPVTAVLAGADGDVMQDLEQLARAPADVRRAGQHRLGAQLAPRRAIDDGTRQSDLHTPAGPLAALLEAFRHHEVRRGLVGGCRQELVQAGALVRSALLAALAGLLGQSAAGVLGDLGQHGGVLVLALVWDQHRGGGRGDRAAGLLESLAGLRRGAAGVQQLATQGGASQL